MLGAGYVTQTFGGYVPASDVFLITVLSLLVLICYLGASAQLHRRRLRRIPIRVHVAGARGKSTTTRLIAAGLRAGGLNVLAKTTGTVPRLIRADGGEEVWPRRGPPSIREQARFISRAARQRADAIVVESMAIRPELIWDSERYLVQATVAVVTNTHADHLEELGPEPGAMAESLRWVVPRSKLLVVAEEAASPPIIERARALGTKVRTVGTAGVSTLARNRLLALAVCEELGVPAATATAGMDRAQDAADAFSVSEIKLDSRRVRFANAFTCNDVHSLELLWRETYAGTPVKAVVLLNARKDRPLRTRQFLEFLARQDPPVTLFLAGDPGAKRLATRAGFDRREVRILATADPGSALRVLAAEAEPNAIIWGMGNYQGLGAKIIEAMRTEAITC